MTIVKTRISVGFIEYIEAFAKANSLELICRHNGQHIDIEYEDNSETAVSISFMSIKHLGFENMLFDYLIRCGLDPSYIPIGKIQPKRDLKKLDEDWEKYRKEILGLK